MYNLDDPRAKIFVGNLDWKTKEGKNLTIILIINNKNNNDSNKNNNDNNNYYYYYLCGILRAWAKCRHDQDSSTQFHAFL